MIATELIPAVGYIRMSSSKQDASPEQQRERITKLAERDRYRIIRWYDDLGISGDDAKKRKGFQRLIRDAQEKADFCAILCWDQDRFGRFDSVEAGHWIFPLRNGGIWLHTVAQGRVDWNDFQSRMTYSIIQEGKHQYLIDLSRNVLRGRIASARAGNMVVLPSYGYDRAFYDETGRQARVVPYGEKFNRPRGWKARLIPAADQAERETIVWLFQTFADSGVSLRWLTMELNRRRVPTRRAGAWTATGVRYILGNPVYRGCSVFGRRRSGKYHQIGDDGEMASGRKRGMRPAPIIVPDTHDPLVDAETFERVQEKLARFKLRPCRPRYNGYILTSGVVYCGHCGRPMTGKSSEGKGRGGHRYYYCPGGQNGTCKGYSVRQDQLDGYTFAMIEDRLLSARAVDQIRAGIHQRLRDRDAHQAAVETLKQQAATLDRKIARGTENLLLADPDHLAELSRLLADWKVERSRVQSDLERAATNPGGKNPEEIAERAVKELRRLKAYLKTGDPIKVRGVVAATVKEIRLWWEGDGKHGRRVAKGVLTFRSPVGVLKSSNNGALQNSILFTWRDLPHEPARFETVAKVVHELSAGGAVALATVAERMRLNPTDRSNLGRDLATAERWGLVRRVGKLLWESVPVSIE